MEVFPLRPVGHRGKVILATGLAALIPLALYEAFQNLVGPGLWFEQPLIGLAVISIVVFGAWLALVNLWAFLCRPKVLLITNEVTWGVPFFRRKRRLADFAAIQIIASPGEKKGFVRPATMDTYQVNIVFRVGQPRRLFFFAVKKIGEARQAARHIADLLKVQLVDVTQWEEEATSKWRGGHSPTPDERLRERGPIQ
jgi:hypothetical protein